MDPITAGEYVLRALDERERREVEAAAATDPGLAREIRRWEIRLSGLALQLKPVAPSPQVWLRLRRALEAPRPAARLSRFTQAWAALATAAALVLGFGLYRQASQPPPAPMIVAEPAGAVYVALLQVPDSTLHWTVSVSQRGHLTVRAGGEAPPAAAGRDAELWLITDAGPRSLGVIPQAGELQREVASQLPIGPGRALAVSLEPKGGSTTGAPTGPVVTSSTLLQAS